MANFLITGGAGFIGSHLARELLTKGHRVRIIDNLSTGSKENISEIINDVDWIEGDIRNLETCMNAVKGMDYVLHQAALGSVPRSIQNPINTHDNNVNGTLNLLISAKEAGVKRFVQASSSSVYGNTEQLPKEETMQLSPLSPYAVSKLANEYYAKVFYQVYGLETISLRYFNVFGPMQNPNSQYAAVIPRFLKALAQGEPPVIYGDGEQSRDFTYIENVVEANVLACLADRDAVGEAYNIACHDRITVNRLYEEICRFAGKFIRPRYENPRAGDIKHSYADIQKSNKLLGYHPRISFNDGLQRTVQWYFKEGRGSLQ
jgi:nucleoside-diphosphate-sugar epimerase